MESRILQSHGVQKRSRSENFTENETNALIAAYQENELLLQKRPLSKHARLEIWNRIGRAVTAVSGIHRAGLSCKAKWKNVQKYAIGIANVTQNVSSTNHVQAVADKDHKTDFDDTGTVDVPQPPLPECLLCSHLIETSSVSMDQDAVCQILTPDLVNSLCTILTLKSTSVAQWKRILMNCCVCHSCYEKAVEAKEVLRLLDVLQKKILDVSTIVENTIRLGHSRSKGKTGSQAATAVSLNSSNAISYTQIRAELLNALKQEEETEIFDVDDDINMDTSPGPVIVNVNSTAGNKEGEDLFNGFSHITSVDFDTAEEPTITTPDFCDTSIQLTLVDPLSIGKDENESNQERSNADFKNLSEGENSNSDDPDYEEKTPKRKSREGESSNYISTRAPMFSDSEVKMLWRQHKRAQPRLHGLTRKNPRFQRIWGKIAQRVNNCSDGTHKRTWKQCVKKVVNLKSYIARRGITAPSFESTPHDLAQGGTDEGEESSPQNESDLDDEFEGEVEGSNAAKENEKIIFIRDAKKKVSTTEYPRRYRAPNFTDKETEALIEEYKEEELRVARWGNRFPAKINWEAIVKRVNSCSDGSHTWTIQQCKNKKKNVNQMETAKGGPKSECTKRAKPFKYSDSSYVVVTPSAVVALKHLNVKLARCDKSPPESLQPRKDFISNLLARDRLRKLKVKLNRRKYFPEKSIIHDRSKVISIVLTRRRERSNEKTEVRPEAVTIESFTCLTCAEKFSLESRRDAHIKKVHEGIKRPYTCEVEGCQDAFTNSAYLLSHVARFHNHDGKIVTHPCEEEGCRYIFTTAVALDRHKNRVHVDANRRHACPDCPKRFINHHLLKAHKERVHEQIRPFVCEVCTRSFHKNSLLEEHQAKVHGDENPEKFQPEHQTCPICGFRSHSRTYIKTHIQRHAGGTSLRWPCKEPNCTYRADRPYGLKLHMFTHTNERNFLCHLCPAAFRIKSHLEYHIRRHDGATPHQCPECQNKFANTKSLKNHLEIIHRAEKKYKCTACGEGFPIRRYLSRHVLICAQGYSGTSKRASAKIRTAKS